MPNDLLEIADTIERNGGWRIAAVKIRAAAAELAVWPIRYSDLQGELDTRNESNAWLVERMKAMEAALRELLDSTLAQMPPFDAGKAAQDAWADRRARARNNAAYLLGAP